MEQEDGYHTYALANWSPPWIDGGQSLSKLIERGFDLNLGYDGWLMLSLFLTKQLEYDMNRVKRQSLNQEPI